VQQRLTGCVDDLQEVIQEIRTAIFDLHGSSSGVTRLRQRLDDAVAQFASTELRTSVQYTGPLSVVDAGLAEHAEAVVREAVSNAVRHADAHSLSVNVAVGDELCIDVTDDGKGIPADITGSGCGTFASARRMSAGRSARTRCRAAAPS
jgi:signal transduction histidine kinase